MTTVTLDDLRAAPLGTVYTDREGDVWMSYSHTLNDRTVLVTPETFNQDAAYVLKKWGPLTLRWTPDQPDAAGARDVSDTMVEAARGVRVFTAIDAARDLHRPHTATDCEDNWSHCRPAGGCQRVGLCHECDSLDYPCATRHHLDQIAEATR